jgi:hypothetical protein
MRQAIPSDLLLRLMNASPAEFAAVERVLGIGSGVSEMGDGMKVPSSKFQVPSRGKAEARYVLRKGYGGWKVVFDFGETVLPDEKGVAYVAALLLDPPREPMHGVELAHRVFGDAVVEGQWNLARDDAESARAQGQARRQCQAVLDDPSAGEVERQEASAELEAIDEWARKHLRGTEGNEQRQVRAIRQAIRRLLKGLRGAMDAQGEPDAVLRSFGEHLHRYLWRPSRRGGYGRNLRLRAGLAGRFTYEPPEGVKWTA